MMKLLVRVLLLILSVSMSPVNSAPAPLTPAEARLIAKEAYIYGFPLVDNYRINYAYFVDKSNLEFKAPWNRITNTARVFTPEDKAIQTPNSDTPYSFAGMDLRAEPLVLTLPKVEASRYYSVQLIDAYTFNFAYLGTRSTGNEGGAWLIAGPRWKGTAPKGIKGVIRSETDFGYALVRTQLFGPDDLENVKKVQAGYKVQTLSQFLGKPAPAGVKQVQWMKPLNAEQQKSSLEFYRELNFVLQAASTHPSEKALFERFARINVGPGRNFDPAKLSPEMRSAIEAGMADAWKEFNEYKTQNIDTGKVVSGNLFGTRQFLKNDYMRRMSGAILGIYGNSREEAMYPAYFTDSAGQALDGSKARYTLRFAPGQLPPAGAFWSLTMYELPASLLYANPLHRYLINSAMLPQLKRDADGGLTVFLQHESPGKGLEANWLPAPKGPFAAIMRLYLPKPEALDGIWKAPPLQATAMSGAAAGTGPALTAAALGGAATVAAVGGNAGTVPVTPETYIRAETDRSFNNVAAMAGGVNKLYHFRAPTPVDKQTVVRMNKDTLYSAGVIDTAAGATITLPDVPKERYMAVLVIDNDHYAPAVFHGAGTHKLPSDTKYVMVAIRTQLFNPDDPKEVALVNKLQDQIVINAKSADPLPPMRWDQASLKALTAQYEQESKKYPSWKGMMGPRGTVDERTRHIAAAAAWGLNPDQEASYLNYSGAHDARVCHRATYRVPENSAFWSITVYGSDGYMKSANAIINSSTVKLNPDGTFTVYFGSQEACGNVANRVDVTEGWNFLMRVYLPGKSVLDGNYKLPEAAPVSRPQG